MRQKRTNLKEERFCKMCNTSFTVSIHSDHKYCSPKCGHESQKGSGSVCYGISRPKEIKDSIGKKIQERNLDPKAYKEKLKIEKELKKEEKKNIQRKETIKLPRKIMVCPICGGEREVIFDSDQKYCSVKCRSLDPNYSKLQSDVQTQYSIDHPEKAEKISKKQKKRFEDPKEHEKASKGQLKRYEDPLQHKLQSDQSIKWFSDPEHRKELSDIKKKAYEDKPEKRIEDGIRQKEKWKDPEFAKKCNTRKAISAPEKKWLSVIEEKHLPFYFNGNAQNKEPFLIGTRIPDFVHFTEKKVIEIYGSYSHANPKTYKPNDKAIHKKVAKDIWKSDADRIKEIENEGYQVFVIWDYELKNIEDILKRLNEKQFLSLEAL